MDVWDKYNKKAESCGSTKRQRIFNSTKNHILNNISSSLSYQEVLIDGFDQSICVIDKDKLNEKKIIAIPCEKIPHGGEVDFSGSKWLITEVNKNNQIQESGVMTQCNFLLKWKYKNKIQEKWCIVEEASSSLIGEKESNLVTIGDARFFLKIKKDSLTDKFHRGMRFYIDQESSNDKLVYEISNPNRFSNVYEGEGIYAFLLKESNKSPLDNDNLMVADFYEKVVPPPPAEDGREGVWL